VSQGLGPPRLQDTHTGYFAENSKNKEMIANSNPNVEKHASYLRSISLNQLLNHPKAG